MKRAALVTRAIDPTAIVAEVQTAGIGAISLFLGTVRDVNDGRAVSGIDYSAYVSMAEEEMQQILAEAEERYGVKAIAVEHRIGPLTLGVGATSTDSWSVWLSVGRPVGHGTILERGIFR